MTAAALRPALDLTTLQGRVVLVTGGSRGLGAAIASTLGAAGMRLVLADIAVQRVQDFAAALAEHDIDAIALPLDVSDAEQCAQAIERVAQRFGRLDALVINSAIDTTAPTGEPSLPAWHRIVANNLGAPFMLSNHAVTLMARQRHGHIVNITSRVVRRASPVATSTGHAAERGMTGLLRSLHTELRPQGVRVTAVEAGGRRSPLPGQRFRGNDTDRPHYPILAQVVRSVLQQPLSKTHQVPSAVR